MQSGDEEDDEGGPLCLLSEDNREQHSSSYDVPPKG